jgi:hypothetical protein
MASFATLPLMDASRDSRIHDWIAEQYSFALSEFEDNHPWRDDPPSLRESKLLPDDFDLIARSPPPSQSDSDRDTLSTLFYDPPLLPSPPPSLNRPPSRPPSPENHTDLEDAFEGLLREMNSWRSTPASQSALTLTLSNRNKVSFVFQFPSSWVDAYHAGASSYSFSTSDTLFGGFPFPTAHCPIITIFFHVSRNTDLFRPTPSSAVEAFGHIPLHL